MAEILSPAEFKRRIDEANHGPLVEYEPGLYYDFRNYVPIYPMEFWKPITENSCKGVVPGYWVSNIGRVWDGIHGRIVPQRPMKKIGYMAVYLPTRPESGYRATGNNLVHRIVMIEFNGIDPDPEKRTVDHIEPYKRNNSEYNLQWVSPEENRRLAKELGLAKTMIGADNYGAKMNEEQARIICQMMQDGRPRHEIYDKFDEFGIKSHSVMFANIYRGKLWSSVSRDYTFASYPCTFRGIGKRSARQIHRYIKTNGDGVSDEEILNGLGLKYQNDIEHSKLLTGIRKVREGKMYPDTAIKE